MIRVDRFRAIERIGSLQLTIARLREVPRRAAEIAAPKIARLVEGQFRSGTDPYGRHWAPLRPSTLRQHGPPPLTASGSLAKRTVVRPLPSRSGLHMLIGRLYGYFHQVGFRVHGTRVPARRILPQAGIPATWARTLRESAREAARRAVGAA